MTVRFNYNQFLQASINCSITRNASPNKDFLTWISDIRSSLDSGEKINSSIDFHCFSISIDKNHLIANDFYRFRYLSIYYPGSS